MWSPECLPGPESSAWRETLTVEQPLAGTADRAIVMRTASLDLTTGALHLREQAAVSLLQPGMALQEFAQTPVARRMFPRGFEQRHIEHSGYLIGTWEIDDALFNVSLGFSAPDAKCVTERCVLESLGLHPCLVRKRPGLLHRCLSALGLADSPLDSPPPAVLHCEDWWHTRFGETAPQQINKSWGSLHLVRDHPSSGPLIEVVFEPSVER